MVAGGDSAGPQGSAARTRWFSSSPLSEEEGARLRRVVRIIGLGMMLAMVVPMAHNLIRDRWAPVIVLFAEEILVAIALILNRRWRIRSATRVLAFSAVLLAATLQLVGRQGVHDVAILIYPGAIVVAAVLLDGTWYVAFAGFAILAFATQYVLEVSGVVAYPMSRYAEPRLLIDAMLILALSAVAAGMLMRNLRHAMARTRESEGLYRSLFESVAEAIVVHDGRGHILDANRRTSELFGYSPEELRALTAGDVSSGAPGFTQRDALVHLTAALHGESQLFEWQCRARDGRLFWVEMDIRAGRIGGAERILVSIRDIDERKRAAAEREHLEEQLRQAQKLESIGRLAGGVAHDFNNLITCILGNVDLAGRQAAPGQPIAENLDEIRHAARRAAELTGQLLAFSRKQTIRPVRLDPAQLLTSTERMLRRLLGETIEVRCESAPGVGRINADPGQLEQVLVNLAVNARDAMPDGGRLTITAEDTRVDDAFCAAHAAARRGEFVRISVADTGTGMPREVQEHVFEPFFTTKPQGKGTGLGLAMVFGAMQQNDGFIVLESEPGRGSRFDLFFPRSSGEAHVPAVQNRLAELPAGSERVLLVEDHPSVRELNRRTLSRLGYDVVACSTGQDAIAACRSSERPFDLLLTDVVLPDVDGRSLAANLAAIRAPRRVLYCSGYTGDLIAQRGILDEGVAFLPKPFTPEELARKVREVLDGPPPASPAPSRSERDGSPDQA